MSLKHTINIHKPYVPYVVTALAHSVGSMASWIGMDEQLHHHKTVGYIIHPCPNFNDGLVEAP